MHLCGVLTVIVTCTVGIGAPGPGDLGPDPGHHTLMCHECRDVHDPRDCQHFARCAHDQGCMLEVMREHDGRTRFSMACRPHHECEDPHRHHGPDVICSECCYTDGCNNDICQAYLPSKLTQAPTVVTTTKPPVLTTSITQSPTTQQHNGGPICMDCMTENPHQCMNYKRCPSGKICGTRVVTDGSTVKYLMSCFDPNDCISSLSLLGKREFPLWTMCMQCCSQYSGCNRDLCGQFMSGLVTHAPAIIPSTTKAATTTIKATTITTTPAPTTTSTTTAATTTVHSRLDPNCQDHEEDGFSCASFDLFNMCSDRSLLAFLLAELKCRKYCGLCTPGPGYDPLATAPPVPRPPSGQCVDYEQDGVRCSDFDRVNLCTDPAVMAYVLAHQKCRKHCGFCPSSGSTNMKSAPVMTTATAPSTTTALTTSTYKPTTTTTTTIKPTTTTTTSRPTTTPTTTTTTSSTTTPPPPTTTSRPTTTTTSRPTTTPATTSTSSTTSPTTTTTTTTTPAPTTTPSTIPSTPTSPITTPVSTTTLATTTAALQTESPCVDIEQEGFKCAAYDTLHFCSSSGAAANMIAHKLCRKHCGLCVPDNRSPGVSGSTQTAVIIPTPTSTLPTATPGTAIPTHPPHHKDTTVPQFVPTSQATVIHISTQNNTAVLDETYTPASCYLTSRFSVAKIDFLDSLVDQGRDVAVTETVPLETI